MTYKFQERTFNIDNAIMKLKHKAICNVNSYWHNILVDAPCFQFLTLNLIWNLSWCGTSIPLKTSYNTILVSNTALVFVPLKQYIPSTWYAVSHTECSYSIDGGLTLNKDMQDTISATHVMET